MVKRSDVGLSWGEMGLRGEQEGCSEFSCSGSTRENDDRLPLNYESYLTRFYTSQSERFVKR